MKSSLRCIPEPVLVAAFIMGAPFLFMGASIAIAVLAARPGIGDVERAAAVIQPGMSRYEVQRLLGKPHESWKDGAEWDYYETRFVGSILRVEFGRDDRVTSRSWWCH